MGNDPSKIEIGSKSLRSETSNPENVNTDYKDLKNTNIAKNELYALFLDDKIVHMSRLEELEDKLEKSNHCVKQLENELNNYKKLNLASNSSSENGLNLTKNDRKHIISAPPRLKTKDSASKIIDTRKRLKKS